MHTLETIQQKLQDLTNRLEIIKKQLDSLAPNLGDDDNLSSLVAKLQSDVGNMQDKVAGFESNISSLNNSYSSVVSSVENNTFSIQNLQSANNSTLAQLEQLNSNNQALSELIQTNTDNIAENKQSLNIVHRDVAICDEKIIIAMNVASRNAGLISKLESRLDELILTVDNLSQHINNFVPNNSSADNELYFIVNGTYVTEEDVESIVNGTYSLPT